MKFLFIFRAHLPHPRPACHAPKSHFAGAAKYPLSLLSPASFHIFTFFFCCFCCYFCCCACVFEWSLAVIQASVSCCAYTCAACNAPQASSLRPAAVEERVAFQLPFNAGESLTVDAACCVRHLLGTFMCRYKFWISLRSLRFSAHFFFFFCLFLMIAVKNKI